MFRLCVLAIGISLLAARVAGAGEGRIELDQLRALAGGIGAIDTPGFPITLSQPGAYFLSGDLSPPGGTTAISIVGRGVSIDLNGFALRGGFRCAPGACAATGSSGVVATSTAVGTRVFGGTVDGFGSTCINLGPNAVVERLRVVNCGRHGIQLGAGSRAVANRVENVGQAGITLAEPGFHGDNVVRGKGLAIASPSISQGSSLSGNACEAGDCARRGTRRYFLSAGTFTGERALTACGAGFHLASPYEILDTSSLEYALSLGATASDAGTGPPADQAGWIRPGSSSSTTENCQSWTSDLATHTGMRARLTGVAALDDPATKLSPWQTDLGACSTPTRAWCVED